MMAALERKTEGMVLNYEEVMRSMLKSEKGKSPSCFLKVDDARSATIELSVDTLDHGYIKMDDIEF